MTKQVLDDVERVLDPGPHLRQRPLHRLGPIPQSFGQSFDDAPLDRDVPGDIAVLKFEPLVRPGIAGIGEDRLLLAVQQGRRLVDVGFVGGGARDRVHHPRGDIDPDMRLHPKMPLVALLGLVHLRVAGLAFVLGRGRGGDDGGINDCFPGASTGRAPPASPRSRRTAPGSGRAPPANAGSSAPSSRPEPSPPTDRCRQSRATPGYRRARPPGPRRPARTTAAKSRSAASAPAQSAAGRVRPSGRTTADVQPTAPTAPPLPSRPKNGPAASAFSSRRIPPAKSCPAAASLPPNRPADSTRSGHIAGAFFQRFPSIINAAMA